MRIDLPGPTSHIKIEQMSSVEDLIGRTRKLGIDLWVSDGMLNFRAPRAALSTELRTELLAHKTSIIEALSEPRFEPAQDAVAIDIPEALVPAWKQSQAGDISLGYINNTNVLRHFKCPMDLPTLEQSLQEMARKHNALRCRFSNDAALPRLVFDCTPEFTTIDLTACSWSDFYAPFIKAAQDIVWRPFVPGECLFRPFVFKLPSSELAVGFVVHHFVVDGWSFEKIPHMWAMEYMRQSGHHSGDANPRGVLQYSDFLLGLTSWSRTQNFQRRLDYWEKTLQGAVPSRLPPDRMLGSDERSFHKSRPIGIDAARVESLSELAASVGTTLSDVLLAGVALALHRELKTPDICLRHIWHGRDEPRLFDMIGHTLTPVILRIQLNPRSRLGDVAQQVHRVAYEAIANQLPGYYVDRILDAQGSNALVKTNFQIRQHPGGQKPVEVAALSASNGVPVWSPDRTFATPSHLQAHEINLHVMRGAVRGQISYLEGVYDDVTIERFIQGFYLALAD